MGGKGRGLEEPGPGLRWSRSICLARGELPQKAAYPTDSLKGQLLRQVFENFSLLSWSPISLAAFALEGLLQADPVLRDQSSK